LVDWGDGTATHHTFPKGQAEFTVLHTYAESGKYLVYAVLENSSGLRGVGGIVVETSSQDSNTASSLSSFIPSISRVRLSDLTVNYSIFGAFMPGDLFFEVEIEDDQGQRHLVGLSDKHEITSDKVITYGNIVGYNPGRILIKKIIINRNITPDFSTNSLFKDSYYTIPELIFDVYATTKDDLISHSVKVVPEILQIYSEDDSFLLPADQLTFDDDGNVKIPLVQLKDGEFIWFDRIEISVTSDMFSNFDLNSMKSDDEVGTTGSWKEIRPGYLVPNDEQNDVYLPVIVNRFP
jgi:hypothetical protein